jgi:hypothetical protein
VVTLLQFVALTFLQIAADTSAAMYEKRHKKYETFEKRGRLREKEKLKHEQYKLKERIDQLRAMDAAAFMALPESSFVRPHGEDDPQLTGTSVNGAAFNEGERRKKEMLESALSLEERYRALLPPEHRHLKRQAPPVNGVSSVEVEHTVIWDSSTTAPPPEEPEPPIRPKLTLPRRRPHSSPSSASPGPKLSIPNRAASKSTSPPELHDLPHLKHKIRQAGSDIDEHGMDNHPISSPSSFKYEINASDDASAPSDIDYDTHGTSISATGKRKRAEPAPMLLESISTARSPRERTRESSSANGTVSHTWKDCMIITAARRRAEVPNPRHTVRHIYAFGCKFPPNLGTESFEFILPGDIASFGMRRTRSHSNGQHHDDHR